MSDYNLLDTRAFENFINSQEKLKNRYSSIKNQYGQIIKNLTENWKGGGADAFLEDSQKVMINITGIQDILSTMCDILSDCRDVFAECDSSLGTNNRNAIGGD